MSKHKKTLKQKIIADLHRQVYSLDNANISSFENKNLKEVENKPSQTIAVNNYPFLVADISKTLILSLLIICSQLILFFLLKKHILVLQGINY